MLNVENTWDDRLNITSVYNSNVCVGLDPFDM